MHDPSNPNHVGERASGHDGPFVTSTGLFGRLRGSGRTGPPTDPPPTDPPPTDPPPSPEPSRSGPGPFTVIRVMVIGAVVLAMMISDAQRGGRYASPAPGTGVNSIPAPVQAGNQGRYDMRVERATPTQATLIGADGTTRVWEIATPAVYAVLAEHQGEDVMVYWRRAGNRTLVVGATGPRGAALPGMEEPADVQAQTPT